MAFSEKNLHEESNVDLAAVRRALAAPEVTWLHVQGRPSPGVLGKLGELYGLHTLAVDPKRTQESGETASVARMVTA